MRNKSVLDAAKGVYPCICGERWCRACGASGLNLHRSNAHHPRTGKKTQTLFSINPPTTRRNTAQRTAAYGNIPTADTTPPLDSTRNVWYNIAVDSTGKQ